jgi:hypothetical protein
MTPERYFILYRRPGKPWTEYNSTLSGALAYTMVDILEEQGLEACVEEDIALYDPISMVWNRITV